jgi:hypothetical protein
MKAREKGSEEATAKGEFSHHEVSDFFPSRKLYRIRETLLRDSRRIVFSPPILVIRSQFLRYLLIQMKCVTHIKLNTNLKAVKVSRALNLSWSMARKGAIVKSNMDLGCSI